jgi:hypothetical protein
MTQHHDRVRAIMLVHELEADRRCKSGSSEGADAVVDLTARVGRIQVQLDGVRLRAESRHPSEGAVSVGTDSDGWLVAVYDAALAQLCGALGVRHCLIEDGVCSDRERQRVELVLLSSVLPLG